MLSMLVWLESSPWLWACALLVAGMVVGSFLNVVVLRLPERSAWEFRRDALEALECGGGAMMLSGSGEVGECPPGIVVERSCCPSCGHRLSWWENVPVLSWFLLRGACRSCGEPISMQYPLVEWGVGLLFVVCGMVSVYSGHAALGVETLCGLVLTGCLVAASGIDVRAKWLPDGLVHSLLWLGLVLSLFFGTTLFGEGRLFASRGAMGIVSLESAVMGAVLGYGFLWLVAAGFRLVTGREGMGHGDFKLLAALGAWVGMLGVLPVVLLSSVVGVVFWVFWRLVHRGDAEMPFGPSLAIAGWCVWVFGVPDVLRVG